MVRAHYVAQFMEKLTFAPETIALLQQRLNSGNPGFLPGDEVSYIASFTTSGTTEGSGGYITFYIPNGTIVTGAEFVKPDGNGDYIQEPLRLPGPIDAGWGDIGNTSFVGDGTWTTSDSDTIADCSAAGYGSVELCPGTLAQVYADTGVFYSSDPRTAFFAHTTAEEPNALRATDDNGYNIDPSIGSDVDPHNLWDTLGVEAFSGVASPTPFHTPYTNFGNDRGNTPYNTGSVVAGSDSGYKLDYSGEVGPWKRAQYPGSRVGNPTGPAIDAITEFNNPVTGDQVVVGQATSAGTAFPLPANTNSVRISIGMLRDGETNHTKLSLQLGTDVTQAYLVNAEVVGGDAGGISDGKDAVWRYFQPSVAISCAQLSISKSIASDFVQPGENVAYTITALNNGFWGASNVILTDTLPNADFTYDSTTAAVLHRADGSTVSLNPTINNTGQTISWDFGTLEEGYGEYITIDFLAAVDANAAPSNTFYSNTLEASYFDRFNTVTVDPISTAPVQIVENLVATKTVTPTNAEPGETLTYTINVRNVGSQTLDNIKVTETLADGLSYGNSSSVTGDLSDIAPVASGQQLEWTFSGQNLAAGGSADITFTAIIDTSIADGTYPNNFVVDYQVNGNAKTYEKVDVSPVTVNHPLAVSKSVTPATAIVGQTASYTISVANTGTTAIDNIIVYEFLPFNSTGTGATNRFDFVNGSSQFTGIGSVIPNVGQPDRSPYSGNTNQQQVTWDFTGQSLAGGASFTITFEAVVGEDIDPGTYPNNLAASYSVNSNTLTTNIFDTAPVDAIPPPPPYSTKTVTPENVISGDTVTYTILVENPAEFDVQDVVIYDFLPTNGGTSDDPNNRFSYVADSTVVTILNDPSGNLQLDKVNVALPPTEDPYSSQDNQEQVSWAMKNDMVAGASFQIEFQAVVGTNMPDGVYGNDIRGTHKDALEPVDAFNQAPVTVGNPVANDPQLLLVKRLTALNGSAIAQSVDDPETADNNINWPTPLNSTSNISTFLSGEIDRDGVRAGDELEYTIYFMSGGNVPITNTYICDAIPANTTYVADSTEVKFGSDAAASSAGQLLADGSTSPCPALAGASKPVLTVNLADNAAGETIPPATSPGTPANSYGYVRFRVTVD